MENEKETLPNNSNHDINIEKNLIEKEKELALEKEMIEKKENEPSLSFFVKYYYFFSEFIICFVYSFFPTWYVELYTDDQTDEYKKIVEIITKKKVGNGEPKDKLKNLYIELEKKEEQLKDLKKKLHDMKPEKEKENQEEIKEDESIDPTDNINPDNFKLIQKLQHLHKVEVIKEKFESLQKHNENNRENEEDSEDEGESINSDPTNFFNFDKNDSEIIPKKRSRSLDNYN